MTPAEHAAGDKMQTQEKEYGLAFGGPIIKDEMHFFFTYEGKDFVTPTAVVGARRRRRSPRCRRTAPRSSARSTCRSTKISTSARSTGLADDDRLRAQRQDPQGDSARHRRQHAAPSAAATSSTTRSAPTCAGSTRPTAGRTMRTSPGKTTLGNPRRSPNGNASIYAWRLDNISRCIDIGAGANFQNKGQKGPALQDDFSLTDLHWHGDHLVKMRHQVQGGQPRRSRSIRPIRSSSTTSRADGAATIRTRRSSACRSPGRQRHAESKNKQFGMYIQDDWQVNDHLTLNLGVRWDYEENAVVSRLRDAAGRRRLRSTADSQNRTRRPGQTYAQTLALGGININDYISTGNNRNAHEGRMPAAPRLLVRPQRRSAARLLRRRRPRVRPRQFDYMQLERQQGALPRTTFNSPNGGPRATDRRRTASTWDPRFLNIDPANLQARSARAAASESTVQQQPEGAVLRSVQPRHAQPGRRLEHERHRRAHHQQGRLRVHARQPSSGRRLLTGQPFGSQWGCPAAGFGSLILGKNGIETTTRRCCSRPTSPTRRNRAGA